MTSENNRTEGMENKNYLKCSKTVKDSFFGNRIFKIKSNTIVVIHFYLKKVSIQTGPVSINHLQ